jgi:hypothetical protein
MVTPFYNLSAIIQGFYFSGMNGINRINGMNGIIITVIYPTNPIYPKKTNVIRKYTKTICKPKSFIPQRLYRAFFGGLVGGVKAEDKADGSGYSQS